MSEPLAGTCRAPDSTIFRWRTRRLPNWSATRSNSRRWKSILLSTVRTTAQPMSGGHRAHPMVSGSASNCRARSRTQHASKKRKPCWRLFWNKCLALAIDWDAYWFSYRPVWRSTLGVWTRSCGRSATVTRTPVSPSSHAMPVGLRRRWIRCWLNGKWRGYWRILCCMRTATSRGDGTDSSTADSMARRTLITPHMRKV